MPAKDTTTNRTVVCANCGATFTVDPYIVRHASHGRFCSMSCYSAYTRRPESVAPRFWAKVKKTDGCWEWQGSRLPHKNGLLPYGRFKINGLCQPTHRVAYELAIGPIPKGMDVLHACDNPPCCRPDHLFLGTNADNMRDMVKKGRSPYGEHSGRAILTEEQVKDIRRLRMEGHTQVWLAKHFGMSRRAIRSILDGKNWRHLL